MAKHDAVDQLMALATAKRADRLPSVGVAGRGQESIDILDPVEGPAGTDPKRRNETGAGGAALASSPGARQPEPSAGPSVAERGRQFLQAIRPLLPAVAGAMRLIDHGAVQTAARLLPLLGGGIGFAGSPPQAAAAGAEQEESARALQASYQALRRDVDALTQRVASSGDLLGRTRTQLERVTAELAGKDTETRALVDRVRLLSAGLIILLMLIIAQMILLVIMLLK